MIADKRKSNRKAIHQRSYTYDVERHGTLDGSIAVDFAFPREDRRMTDEADLERIASQVTRRGRGSRTMRSNDSHEEPQRLQSLLIQALVESSAPLLRSFIPRHILLQIITQKAVETELKLIKRAYSLRNGFQSSKKAVPLRKCLQVSLDLIDIRRIARQICGTSSFPKAVAKADRSLQASQERRLPHKSYRNLFAVLILIGVPEEITSFVEEGICDADLPLIKIPRKRSRRGSNTLRCRNNDCPLKCVARWGDKTVTEFEQWQWKVLSPFFAWSKDQPIEHQSFEAERILPFISRQKTPSCGGFGQVYRVHIHPDYHAFHDPQVCICCEAVPRTLLTAAKI